MIVCAGAQVFQQPAQPTPAAAGGVTFPFEAYAYFFDDRDGNTSGLSELVCRSICRQPVDRVQTEVQK